LKRLLVARVAALKSMERTKQSRIGASFRGGRCERRSEEDPRRDLPYCGLETLCRVFEKANVLAEEEPDEWQS